MSDEVTSNQQIEVADGAAGNSPRLCPSARCEDGAILLGIVGSDGRIAYVTPQMRIEAGFVEKAQAGRLPEKRFRFSNPCIQNQCRHWSGVRCQVIDRALTVIDEMLPADNPSPVPQCSIRPDCRWFSQVGMEACRVCPFVITGVWIEDEPASRPAMSQRGN